MNSHKCPAMKSTQNISANNQQQQQQQQVQPQHQLYLDDDMDLDLDLDFETSYETTSTVDSEDFVLDLSIKKQAM